MIIPENMFFKMYCFLSWINVCKYTDSIFKNNGFGESWSFALGASLKLGKGKMRRRIILFHLGLVTVVFHFPKKRTCYFLFSDLAEMSMTPEIIISTSDR